MSDISCEPTVTNTVHEVAVDTVPSVDTHFTEPAVSASKPSIELDALNHVAHADATDSQEPVISAPQTENTDEAEDIHVSATSTENVTNVENQSNECLGTESSSSEDGDWHPGMGSDIEDIEPSSESGESDNEEEEAAMDIDALEARYMNMCRSSKIPSAEEVMTPEQYREQLGERGNVDAHRVWRANNKLKDTDLTLLHEKVVAQLCGGEYGFEMRTPKDNEFTTALKLFTQCNCDLEQLSERLMESTVKSPTWLEVDILAFERELQLYGKDFERFKVEAKSYDDVINFYFQWMQSPRSADFVALHPESWKRFDVGPIHNCNLCVRPWKGDPTRVVEAILNRRKNGTRWEYEVQWQNREECSWESKKELRHSPAFQAYKSRTRSDAIPDRSPST
eukprot:CFRG3082T1